MFIKYISLCSGVESASLAWGPLGWEPVAFAEVDDFPSAVIAARYPDVPNLGDVTEVDWSQYKGQADVLVGGTPCFPADTLVLCERGFKRIQDVEEGDYVVSHKGNLCRVLATGQKQGEVGELKIHGMMRIKCTPNHPILTSRRCKCDKDSNGSWFRFKEESFVPASESVGLSACSVTSVACEVPEFPDVYKLSRGEILELIGWYLGDGSIAGKGKRNPTIRVLELSISPKSSSDL